MAVRKYELMVILDPVRTEEQQQETIGKIEAFIAKHGGVVDGKDNWGKKRFAYPINNRREGYYLVLTYDSESNSTLNSELDRVLKIEEVVLRHMVTSAVVGKSKGKPRPTREELEAKARREAYERSASSYAPAESSDSADAPEATEAQEADESVAVAEVEADSNDEAENKDS